MTRSKKRPCYGKAITKEKILKFRHTPALLTTLALVACAGVMRNAKPGIDFPDNLAVFQYFSKPAVTALAHALVDSYQPVGEYNTEPFVCDRETCGSFAFMRDVRWSIYNTNGGYDMADSTKPAFLAAVRIANAWPAAVRWFYGTNADAVLEEMVTYARTTITGEYRTRQAYSSEQVAEMLTLYADTADQSLPHLHYALQPSPNFVQDGLKAINAPEPEYVHDNYRAYWAEIEKKAKFEDGFRQQLAQVSGLTFDRGGYETWKFAQRRIYNGGREIAEDLPDLISDAAQRARDKAEELRNE